MADDTLRVRQIELVDDDGEVRAFLGSSAEGHSFVSIQGRDGNPHVQLSTSPEGDPLLVLTGRELTDRVVVSVSPESLGLCISRGTNQTSLELSVIGSDLPVLSLVDNQGRPRANLILVKSGEPILGFLDEEGNITHKIPSNSQPAAPEERSLSSLLQSFSHLAAAIAVVAGTIYVLGLAALWAPITRVYTHDISTGASAVALMPNTQVAAQGMAIIVGPAALALLSFTAALVIQMVLHRGTDTTAGFLLNRYVRSVSTSWPRWLVMPLELIVTLVTALVVVSAFWVVLYLTGLSKVAFYLQNIWLWLYPFSPLTTNTNDALSLWLLRFSVVFLLLGLLFVAGFVAPKVAVERYTLSASVAAWREDGRVAFLRRLVSTRVSLINRRAFFRHVALAFVLTAVAAGLAGAARPPPTV